MSNATFEKKIKEHAWGAAEYLIKDGCIQSVRPATAHFGAMYWSAMVPPFPPRRVLLLGVGFGTIAEIIKRVHGDQVHITGVDLEPQREAHYWVNDIVQADAKKWVENQAASGNQPYDCVIVDIFDGKAPAKFTHQKRWLKDLNELVTESGIVITNQLQAHHEEQYAGIFSRIQVRDTADGNLIAMFWKGEGVPPFVIRASDI